jgi:hypothetical protein
VSRVNLDDLEAFDEIDSEFAEIVSTLRFRNRNDRKRFRAYDEKVPSKRRRHQYELPSVENDDY